MAAPLADPGMRRRLPSLDELHVRVIWENNMHAPGRKTCIRLVSLYSRPSGIKSVGVREEMEQTSNTQVSQKDNF